LASSTLILRSLTPEATVGAAREALHDKLWIVGGNIPEADRMVLKQLGYRGVFPTGSRTDDIVSFIRENVR